ncbi:hypothetical protein FDP41_004911 [Naegleria fowleri]|uniref:Uncharacterized protein n=1 Tax=Naegleria fowleri TaxID=5763 RepID=A0A6A5BMS2_NAEFO|nr:uncharacterized protein FDP41_004911 [Naegleria fowleri]KAF0976236.1 hypothetical protein FDP41_004911 [Naegleria fowleri]
MEPLEKWILVAGDANNICEDVSGLRLTLNKSLQKVKDAKKEKLMTYLSFGGLMFFGICLIVIGVLMFINPSMPGVNQVIGGAGVKGGISLATSGLALVGGSAAGAYVFHKLDLEAMNRN